MSPVSVNARLAAARMELFLASAVSRRRGRGASPSGPVDLAGLVAAALATRRSAYGKCAHTPMLTNRQGYRRWPRRVVVDGLVRGERRGGGCGRRPGAGVAGEPREG